MLRKSILRLFYNFVVAALFLSLNGLASLKLLAQEIVPADFVSKWHLVDKAFVHTNADSIVLQGGYAVAQQVWTNAEMTVRMRAPLGTPQVQLWGGFRYRDRDSRYVFALRGGHDNDIYLARYAPNGGTEFLGFAPLDFKPVPGTWYQLRVVMSGSRFQIYLNDEKIPRINVVDDSATWTDGSILLGGGWLPAEYAGLRVKALTPEEQKTILAVGDQTWSPPKLDKEAIRKSERAAYVPARLNSLGSQRTELSLDGNWLFLPDYQLKSGQKPFAAQFDDNRWHVMHVPDFWTPGLSWLHGETGFPELEGVARTKGVADSLYVQETRRVEAYTFDWKKTKAAWYRNYIELPDNLGDRRFELTFNAIAKISEIWVNGIKVGTHTGMFGRVKCDITKAIHSGRNVVAVHVISEADTKLKGGDTVEGVAVTVPVTSKMLHTLPHGMLQDDVGGIWQPVKLTVTSPIEVNNVFVQPSLHGAQIDLAILNSTTGSAKVDLFYEIISAQDDKTLFKTETPKILKLAAGRITTVKLKTPHLNPKLWSPADPNFYKLVVRLSMSGRDVDTYVVQFGFRTFTTDGSKFLLNGHPYWLRGANPFPNTLRPNDEVLARRFMQFAHDGNVRVTRSHIVPFTSTWLDAADETGVAVSFEGTWPWLMIKGEPPSEKLLKVWKDEFLSLIHEYRNHPSIILWTVNNEMNFARFDENDPVLLKKKWTVLNDMIKAMRRSDPTRPVVAYSGYTRHEAAKGFHEVVHPNGFDDGDVDDIHRYYGWYNESFFNLYDGAFLRWATPGRPYISQEMSTGYPNNDDGHPARFYLFKHHTPQSLVGDDAYEHRDPAIFLKRQAFMTKELTETLRRTGHYASAGVLLFSYFTWFQTPWSASQFKPWPGYFALKAALQPVLVSAELYGRHFYAGDTVKRRVCIVNDSEDYTALPASELTWEVKFDDKILSHGNVKVSAVSYYSNRWLNMVFTMPERLPEPRVDGQLVLTLKSGDKVLSQNEYDIVLATTDWATRNGDALPDVSFIGAADQADAIFAGVAHTQVASLSDGKTNDLVIVGDANKFLLQLSKVEQVKQFVSAGGNVLLLNPKSALTNIAPGEVTGYVEKEGEIVTIHVPESPVFSGIEPLDLSWFRTDDRQLPMACSGVYQIAADCPDITALARQCDLHGYLQQPEDIKKYQGTPLVEVRLGKGRLIASEMNFDAGRTDPISRRLLSNLVHYLSLAEPLRSLDQP